MFARQSFLVWSAPHSAPAFRRQHDLLTAALEPLADDLFRASGGIEAAANWIHIGSIKKINARFDRSIHDGKAHGFVTLPTERHGSQTNLRHFESCPTHTFRFHSSPPSFIQSGMYVGLNGKASGESLQRWVFNCISCMMQRDRSKESVAMGRIIAQVRVTNALDPSHEIQCDALVD